jgi:hypothetical protein
MRQLKARTQGVGNSLQEFATAVEQLAHRTYPALPEQLSRVCVTTDGVSIVNWVYSKLTNHNYK